MVVLLLPQDPLSLWVSGSLCVSVPASLSVSSSPSLGLGSVSLSLVGPAGPPHCPLPLSAGHAAGGQGGWGCGSRHLGKNSVGWDGGERNKGGTADGACLGCVCVCVEQQAGLECGKWGSGRSLDFSHTAALRPTLDGQDEVIGPVSTIQRRVEAPFALLSPIGAIGATLTLLPLWHPPRWVRGRGAVSTEGPRDPEEGWMAMALTNRDSVARPVRFLWLELRSMRGGPPGGAAWESIQPHG